MIFFSYKSEDANLVRGVAERLLSSGIDLWFNEYQIMPANYDAFQAAIDEGIRKATHAIVFTNDRWSSAEWCQYEMRELLRHLHDRNRILEVCIPKEEGPHLNFHELSDLVPIVFKGKPGKPQPQELDELSVEIMRKFKIPEPASFPKVKRTGPQAVPRMDLIFSTGPFDFSISRTEKFESYAGSRSLLFVGNYESTKVYLDLVSSPFSSAIQHLSIRSDGTANDRKVYVNYLRHAHEWLQQQSKMRGYIVEAKGLHLVFIGRQSQLGLTYKHSNPDSEVNWERRYVVTWQGEHPEERGELTLIFATRVEGSDAEQFKKFCRLTPQMDEIARSLRYDPAPVRWKILANAALIVSRASYFALSLFWLKHASELDSSAQLCSAAVLAGFLGADLVLMLFRPVYRRIVLLQKRFLDDVLEGSAYEQFTADLVWWLQATPVQYAASLFAGVDVIGKGLLYILILWFILLTSYPAGHPVISISLTTKLIIAFILGFFVSQIIISGMIRRKRERIRVSPAIG